MFDFRTIVKKHNGSETTSSEDATKRALILFSIQYAMIIILFLLNLFADAKPKQLDPRLSSLKNPCPKLFASFASKLTFAWVSPLMWKGFRKPLEPSMLWKMDPEMTSRQALFLRHFFGSGFVTTPQFDNVTDNHRYSGLLVGFLSVGSGINIKVVGQLKKIKSLTFSEGFF